MRFDEQKIGYHRAEAAQRGDEPELRHFFAKIEIQFNIFKMQLPMLQRNCSLSRTFHHAKNEKHREREKNAAHNSLP